MGGPTEDTKRSPNNIVSGGPLSWLVSDAPEYEERKKRTQFVPPAVSIKDVHAAVPRHLFEKSTVKGLYYIGRHVVLSALFYVFATRIEQLSWTAAAALGWSSSGRAVLSWAFWALYWFWQSVSFAGMWVLGMSSTLLITSSPLRLFRQVMRSGRITMDTPNCDSHGF